MEFFFKQTYTCIPKSENDVRMQAKLGKKNPAGLPVGVVSVCIKRRRSYADFKHYS